MEEAFPNIEAPDVLEAVQQPVGVGGIAARLELPEPDEPRHAGVGRLFEQMLEVSPKPGRDLTKKLDKLAARAGWYTFVSAQAHAIATGKAPARRNAEIMVVQEVTRWRREVERFTPARLEEFEAGIHHALEHPASLQRPEGR